MTLLIEKHRPKGLKNVFFHKNQANRLHNQIEKSEIPHLIISGYEGSLKENFLHAIAYTAYGDDYRNKIEFTSVEEFFSTKAKNLRDHSKYERYFSEAKKEKKRIYDKYNIEKTPGRSSKEEGFKQYLKSISRSASVGENDYRLFVLYEANRLTSNIQNSLRRMMEKYSATTRFVFVLENSSDLIEAIRSRCFTINLTKPDRKKIKSKLIEVKEKENINIKEEAIDAVIYLTNQDYMKCLNLLDALKATKTEEITIKEIKKLLNKIKIKNYEKSLNKALKGNTKESINLIDELVYEENVKFNKIIEEWRKSIHNLSIDKEAKKELIKKLATFDKQTQELPRDPNQMKKLGRTLYESFLSSISSK